MVCLPRDYGHEHHAGLNCATPVALHYDPAKLAQVIMFATQDCKCQHSCRLPFWQVVYVTGCLYSYAHRSLVLNVHLHSSNVQSNKTALDWAREQGHDNIAELLKDRMIPAGEMVCQLFVVLVH